MGAEPVVVLYASISVLNWMRAATGSQCNAILYGAIISAPGIIVKDSILLD